MTDEQRELKKLLNSGYTDSWARDVTAFINTLSKPSFFDSDDPFLKQLEPEPEPKNMSISDALKQRADDYSTILHIAAQNIMEAQRAEKAAAGAVVEQDTIALIKAIPNELLTHDLLTLNTQESVEQWPILHLFSAQPSETVLTTLLDKIPSEELTAKLLKQTNHHGDTFLHVAARNENPKILKALFDKIPPEQLTDELLLLRQTSHTGKTLLETIQKHPQFNAFMNKQRALIKTIPAGDEPHDYKEANKALKRLVLLSQRDKDILGHPQKKRWSALTGHTSKKTKWSALTSWAKDPKETKPFAGGGGDAAPRSTEEEQYFKHGLALLHAFITARGVTLTPNKIPQRKKNLHGSPTDKDFIKAVQEHKAAPPRHRSLFHRWGGSMPPRGSQSSSPSSSPSPGSSSSS